MKTKYVSRGTVKIDLDADSNSLAEGSDPPYVVHGYAIGAGDEVESDDRTIRWTGDALSKLAKTLPGKPLTDKHSDSPHVTIGEITSAAYDGTGVAYEAECDHKGLAKRIANGRLDVSPRIAHRDPADIEPGDDGVIEMTANDVGDMRHVSLVQNGAAASNSVSAGASPNEALASLSAGAVRQHLVDCESTTTVQRDVAAQTDTGNTDDGSPDTDTRSTDAGSSDSPTPAEQALEQLTETGVRTPEQHYSTQEPMADFTELTNEVDEYDNPILVEQSDYDALEADAEAKTDLEAQVETLREEKQALLEDRLADLSDAMDVPEQELTKTYSAGKIADLHDRLVGTTETGAGETDTETNAPDGENTDMSDTSGSGTGSGSGTAAPRGGSSEGDSRDTQELNGMARSAAGARDIQQAREKDMNLYEHVEDEYDVSISDFSDSYGLREAVNEKRAQMSDF